MPGNKKAEVDNTNTDTKTAKKEDGDIVSQNDKAINEHISKSLKEKVESLVHVFKKDFRHTRPYCNKVLVRVDKNELK